MCLFFSDRMQKWFYSFNEAGTDEAGRGCLAGPVTAAAVVLPQDFEHPLLNDSKQMSPKNRDILREVIEREAVSFCVAHIDVQQIDEINILNASILAMQQALKGLMVQPDFVLVDGNRFKKFNEIPFACMVKGDARFVRIAAASVLAKTHRDEFMHKIHQEFPQYHWDKNKGYPTQEHRKAIEQYGVTPYHRTSFQLLPSQLKLDL